MKRLPVKNINTREQYSKILKGIGTTIGFNLNRAEAVCRHLPSYGPVLDVGCWKGYYLNYWKQRLPHIQTIGADFQTEALAYCKANYPFITTHEVDVTKRFPFENASVDTVVCMEVLEHLEDPQFTANELVRVASHRVIVTVPFAHLIKSPYHLWEYDDKSLRGLFPKLKNIATYRAGNGFDVLLLVGDK